MLDVCTEVLGVDGVQPVDEVGREEINEELREPALRANVFAWVDPVTKLVLVTLFQKTGHVVAMAGDGVNDAPALKKADIGIAMGQRGTQVAQEAAHMVLRDDAFASIIAAKRLDLVIFGNIRKFVVYLMSCNMSEVLVVGLAVGGGLPLPLLPLQILFLNLVTDVFPAFALGLEQGDENVMRATAPRSFAIDHRPSSLDAQRGAWLSITATTLGAFALVFFWLWLGNGEAVTLALLTLALAQLWNVFSVRDAESGLFLNDVSRNKYVRGAIAVCLALIAAGVWLPGLAGRSSWNRRDGPGWRSRQGRAFYRSCLGKSGSRGCVRP